MGRCLLWIALGLGIASGLSPFSEFTKTCAPDCTKFGNCNGETGTCDCPFGLAGPTCEVRLFPACHSSLEPSTHPRYGTWYPKNCFCIKQLREHPLSCPSYLHYEGNSHAFLAPCFYEIIMAHNLLCYRYKGRPEADQLSDSPHQNDTAVEWLQVTGYPVVSERLVEAPPEIKTVDGGKWRPLTECPNKCNNRGWCQIQGSNHQGHHSDPVERWCNCHSFYEGRSCEIASPYHCYRNCSGVGSCVDGWCHCQPGYWGHGCTRRKAYVSSVGWRPNHAEIKVYVYDLPNMIVHRKAFQDQWSLVDPMYNAEIEFTDQLLGDWAVRTENPWEAALFYVPMFTYWYTGNIGHPYYLMMHVVHHLQGLAPFFNATSGRNHVMWATNDRGVCKLQMAPLEVQHPIKMVHFGQAPRRPYAHRLSLGSSTGAMSAAQMVTGALPKPGFRFAEFPEFNAGDIVEENEICVRPEKDVIAPNYLHKAWVLPEFYGAVWNTTFLPDGSREVTRRLDGPNRTTLVFFAGYTKSMMVYSQGVRQAIHKMFSAGGRYDPAGPNHRADYRVSLPVHDGPQQMQRAVYCLAPMGSGWGIRLAEAMVTGCVPVIIQDHVYQPLWDVMPFEEFSIRLSRTDVANIVDILDDVTPTQLARLQAGVDKHHRAFFWDPENGGLAYNATLTALKRRALSLWSVNYRRHRLRQ